jgi:hypothetical protein
MTEINHFPEAYKAADKILNFNRIFNPDNWIIIKDEDKIVKLNVSGGDGISVYRSIIKLLESY